jgi:hypothetical protein
MGKNPEPIIIRIRGKRVFTGAYVTSKGVKKCLQTGALLVGEKEVN